MNDIKVPPFTDEQKELIAWTEKIANGKKICDVDGIDDDIQDIQDLLNETIKNIESHIETNEEWFCQLSTKEKAQWLADKQGKHKAIAWEEWLKEPHVNKE